jgi:hypothetical protein
MAVNIGIDLKDPFGSREAARYSDQRNREIYQQRLDNRWRNKMFQEDRDRWYKTNLRADQRLTRLAVDAKRAGVSLLSAMGSPGQSPAHMSLPAGQGGRVSAYTPSRNSSTQLQIDLSRQQSESNELQNQNQHIQNQILQTDLQRKQLELRRMYYPETSDIPSIYVPAYDNKLEAMNYPTGQIPVLNPELNFELPEVVGGYQYARPRFDLP